MFRLPPTVRLQSDSDREQLGL